MVHDLDRTRSQKSRRLQVKTLTFWITICYPKIEDRKQKSNITIDNGVPLNASDWDNHDQQCIPNTTLNGNNDEIVDIVRPIFTPTKVKQPSGSQNVNTVRVNNSTYCQEVPFLHAAPMVPIAYMAPMPRNYQGSQYRYDPLSYAQNQRMQNHQLEQSGQQQWSLTIMSNQLNE